MIVNRSPDWPSFISTLLLAAIGLLMVFSATHTDTQTFSLFFKKQFFGLGIAIGLYWLFASLDHRALMRWGYFCYFGC